MTSPSPRRDPNPDARWLCSHLVRLNFPGDQSLSETGLLEEIEPTRAWVAVEAAYPLGSRVDLTADDFDVSAEVVRCRARENDYRLQLRFLGAAWSPRIWRPDHLYLPPSEQSKEAGRGPPSG